MLATIAVSGCSINPATGDRSFTGLMSFNDEIRIGRKEHGKILRSFGGRYNDKVISNYVSNIGNRLAAKSEFPNIKWTSITQEFGTISGISVIKSLRSESSWNHYSNKEGLDLLNHWSKEDLLGAFRLFDYKWEDKIILRGSKLFNQALKFLLN